MSGRLFLLIRRYSSLGNILKEDIILEDVFVGCCISSSFMLREVFTLQCTLIDWVSLLTSTSSIIKHDKSFSLLLWTGMIPYSLHQISLNSHRFSKTLCFFLLLQNFIQHKASRISVSFVGAMSDDTMWIWILTIQQSPLLDLLFYVTQTYFWHIPNLQPPWKCQR